MINSVANMQLNPINKQIYSSQTNTSKSQFGELLKSAINEVNDTQVQSDVATERLARGENVELHDVMIAAQKASITMQAALELRNKAVEAYQEMMRMQV